MDIVLIVKRSCDSASLAQNAFTPLVESRCGELIGSSKTCFSLSFIMPADSLVAASKTLSPAGISKLASFFTKPTRRVFTIFLTQFEWCPCRFSESKLVQNHIHTKFDATVNAVIPSVVEFWGLPYLILFFNTSTHWFGRFVLSTECYRTRKLDYNDLDWPRCSARVTESLALTDGGFCQMQTLYILDYIKIVSL